MAPGRERAVPDPTIHPGWSSARGRGQPAFAWWLWGAGQLTGMVVPAGTPTIRPTSVRRRIGQLRADATRLARMFANAPRLEAFGRARRLRDRAFGLLDGRQRRTEFADLSFLAGATCGMLAEITQNLGFNDAAMAHARRPTGADA